MEDSVEMELCANCKREIPHTNYVMHTAHCARNISLCPICKEPVSKAQLEQHKQQCNNRPLNNKSSINQSSQVTTQKTINSVNGATSQISAQLGKVKIADTEMGRTVKSSGVKPQQMVEKIQPQKKKQSSDLIPCKFCDLELSKLELTEHESYCGSRTDKCNECGELVMFKYKKLHEESNHGFLKLNDEPGPRPTWDSTTQRTAHSSSSIQLPSDFRDNYRPMTLRSNSLLDTTLYAFPDEYRPRPPNRPSADMESYKKISRRLDCKTEYIKNLLHDSASITVPLRTNGAVPRNHFNHNKGPAPLPPRKRNPPTELTIPCEFCDVPMPHRDLIEHEAICRRDYLSQRSPRVLNGRPASPPAGYDPTDPYYDNNNVPYDINNGGSGGGRYDSNVNSTGGRYDNNGIGGRYDNNTTSGGNRYDSNGRYDNNGGGGRYDSSSIENSYGNNWAPMGMTATNGGRYEPVKITELPSSPPPSPVTKKNTKSVSMSTSESNASVTSSKASSKLSKLTTGGSSSETMDSFCSGAVSPEVQLPCEFCCDMIPASLLLRHQAACVA